MILGNVEIFEVVKMERRKEGRKEGRRRRKREEQSAVEKEFKKEGQFGNLTLWVF